MSAPSVLAEVWRARKAAVPIWAALSAVAEAEGRNHFTVKRFTLARLSGIQRMPTVSEALTALETCGVIKREVRNCRRPDGTLFHRLRVRLLRRITEIVPGELADRDTLGVPGDRITKNVSTAGYEEPGTARLQGETRNSIGHQRVTGKSTGNRITKSVTHPLKRMPGRAASLKTPRRPHAAPAFAAGSRRCAEAPRPRPAGAACLDDKIAGLSKQSRGAMDSLARQVGCAPGEFEIDGSIALLDAAGLWLLVRSDGHVTFRRHADAERESWTGSAEQLDLVRRARDLAAEPLPADWKRPIPDDQSATAREVAWRVGCRIADFVQDPNDPSYLLLGAEEPTGDGLWLVIDRSGKRKLRRKTGGATTEETWAGSEEQVTALRRARKAVAEAYKEKGAEGRWRWKLKLAQDTP